MGAIALFLASLFIAVSASAPAVAESRIALAIGNGGYELNGFRLKNPTRDATAVAERLEALGYDVTLVLDADLSEMTAAIRDFGRRLKAGGPDAVGLVFYSGHGVQVDGLNYLLPIDATVETDADAASEGLRLEPILRQMANAKNRANVIILDACRNLDLPAAVRSANAGRGLAATGRQPNMLIAYSTEPGQTASDGRGALSPYTEALLTELASEEPAELMFKRVGAKVVAMTNGAQRPWFESGLIATSAADDLRLAPSSPARRVITRTRPGGESEVVVIGEPGTRLEPIASAEDALQPWAVCLDIGMWDVQRDFDTAGTAAFGARDEVNLALYGRKKGADFQVANSLTKGVARKCLTPFSNLSDAERAADIMRARDEKWSDVRLIPVSRWKSFE